MAVYDDEARDLITRVAAEYRLLIEV